jgi:cytochrome oxidase assembly protein ShyY1
MYRKKLTYSFFTVPLACVAYNIHQYQKNNFWEKMQQVKLRGERIQEKPKDLASSFQNNKFPWLDLNSKEFDQTYSYVPYEITGFFDHAKEIHVKKNKNGEEGFEIITPFYCYNDSTGQPQPIFVDRGWVDYDSIELKKHLIGSHGIQKITGFLAKGNYQNKYSTHNDLKNNNWDHINLEEMAAYRSLSNKEVSSKFLIRAVQLNDGESSGFPRILAKNDLFNFPISAETNLKYAKIWQGVAFLAIFSNVYLWVAL